MKIEEIATLQEEMVREARKWIGYLETVQTKEEREKELTRKLMETWLEGYNRGTRS